MSVTVSPDPYLYFMNPNNSGAPAAGFLLFTYQAGTSIKQNTWTDSTQTVMNANPIVLDANGAAYVWLDPSLKYKYVLSPPNDTDPPTSPLRTVDNLEGPITNSVFAQFAAPFVYPQTAAEKALAITPTNFAYPSLNVFRYGAAGDGVTDDRAAILTAWQVAKQQGGGQITFPFGATYLVTSLDAASPLNLPNQNTDGSVGTQSIQTQFYFSGGQNIVFDFQGSTIKSNLTGGGALMLFDNCINIKLLRPRFLGVQVMSSGVVTFGTITGGSGYTNGTYNNVPLTGGTGGGAVGGIVVSGGAVQSVVVSYPGGNYVVGDTLSCSNSNIGGSGSGFSVPITSISGAGPTVQVAAPNALTFCGLTGPCSDITVTDLNVESCYTGFWCLANPNTANTVSRVSLLGVTKIRNGYYGVALQNGGDECFIENLYTYRMNRTIFIYGAQNVVFTAFSDQGNLGFQSVIKAYSRSARNINGRYTLANAPGQSSSVQNLAIQVQCDPAVITTPPTVQNVYLEWDEQNFISGGANIEFDYYAGTGGLVQTSTSSALLFNNIVIRGFSNNKLQTTVQLTTAAAQCLINYDLFQYTRPGSGNDLNNNNGFVVSRKFTYTPVISWGGGNSGWAFSTQTADYYIQGGMCEVIGQIIVSTKGSSTGAVTIAMPFPTRADSSRNPILHAIGFANFSSLAGPIIGYLTNSSATANLVTQGAAAVATVTDSNFTSTSNLLFQARFPL